MNDIYHVEVHLQKIPKRDYNVDLSREELLFRYPWLRSLLYYDNGNETDFISASWTVDFCAVRITQI